MVIFYWRANRCPVPPPVPGELVEGREVSSSVAKLFAHFAEDLAKLTEVLPAQSRRWWSACPQPDRVMDIIGYDIT